MAAHVLPVANDPAFYDFSVVLEGAVYFLEFRWNERAGAWVFSIYDADEQPLATGRQVVLGANLLGRSGDVRLPPGAILAFDTSRADIDPGRADLGERVKLVYVDYAGV